MPAPSTSAPVAAPAPVLPSAAPGAVPPSAAGTAGPGGRPEGAGGGSGDPAGDVARWGVFCCVLVPLVLIAFGTSLGGAGGAALGLASVTAGCRLLLRRAERGLHD
ncbi:hypothetical protein [Streptomyces termitum]|uniref:hypothetical protein n=1 Tax=Streptomyces termitum TaxID=67368 RepID=UPI0033BAEB61